jgi:hypothetical protein
MKPANTNSSSSSNEIYRNWEHIAMIAFVVLLITTFVAACIYISIDGFLSK